MPFSLRNAACSLLILWLPLLLSCTLGADSGASGRQKTGRQKSASPADPAFPETFERGNKRAYAAGDVQLATGLWRLENALIGKADGDLKHDEASLRMAAGGSAEMLFDISEGVAAISLAWGDYGNDAGSALPVLYYSTDGGANWQRAEAKSSGSSAGLHLITCTFRPLTNYPVRFSIHNEGHGRINVDDFNIVTGTGQVVKGTESQAGTAATRDDNAALGNPSSATTDVANANNYLLIRPQYTLSYNNGKGMANWVSWHLSMAWRGTATRCNCFFSDAALPADFYHALTSNYIATGFDRGHLCPSDDRTGSAEDNAATFLMSNMSPQAPFLNQQPWEKLEEYARELASQGNELYIIAGGYGTGGAGSKGTTSNTIAGGRINVPSHFWKILVVLPVGTDDVKRITKDTRVIAVDMPNTQASADHDWTDYRTSVKAIEAATGYRFLSNVPGDIGEALKRKVDDAPIR